MELEGQFDVKPNSHFQGTVEKIFFTVNNYNPSSFI